mgnify:CR=1 FL=1
MQGPLYLYKQEKNLWIDWCFTRSNVVSYKWLLIFCIIAPLSLLDALSSKAEEERKIHKSNHGRWQILKGSWHSKLPFVAKVFIWRVLIGGLPLGLALKRRGLATSNFCIVQMEDNTHRFIQCLIVCQIWSYISQIWHGGIWRLDSGCLHNLHRLTQN